MPEIQGRDISTPPSLLWKLISTKTLLVLNKASTSLIIYFTWALSVDAPSIEGGEMSFGFGVGDFLAVIQIAQKIRREFAEAPAQFKAISEEVRSLSFVVQDVEVELLGKTLTDGQYAELHTVVTSCQAVLSDLERTIESFKELATTDLTTAGGKKSEKRLILSPRERKANEEKANREENASYLGNSQGPLTGVLTTTTDTAKRSIAKRVWKRLKWEPTEIQELRSRINSNVILLNSFNGRLVRDNVAKLVQHQDDQERQDLLNWLSSTNYATQQGDYIGRREEGTGQWMLESSEFQSWASGSKSTLFCPGIPGAGETILASIAIEELEEKFGNDAMIAIAYIYCNFQRQGEQSAASLLSNILKQIVQTQSPLPSDVEVMYDRHKLKGTRPSVDEIRKILQSICSSRLQRTFVVIDALDECQISDGSRATLTDCVLSLQESCNLNLLVTSRFSPDITESFRSSQMLEIRASQGDITRYLRGSLTILPSFVLRDPSLQEQISSEIAEAADGMFLLAQLYLNSLVGKRSPKAIKNALKGLISGANTYDSAYNDAMDRIKGQVPDQTELALQVLSWVTCAKRQLTTVELQTALAVEIGEQAFDEDNIPDIIDMVSVCAGLVTVDEQSNIIRLVHYTAQEYFERHQATLFPNAHHEIGTVCVTYLTVFGYKFNADFSAVFGFSSEMEAGRSQMRAALYTQIDHDPFCGYAAVFWGHHMREQTPNAMDSATELLILSLLDDHSKLNTLLCIMFARDTEFLGKNQELYFHCRDDISDISESMPSPLHVVTWFGLTNLVQVLLNRGCEIDHMDCFLQTALSRAVSKGLDDIVHSLFAHSQSNIEDSVYFHNGLLLSMAARYNHATIADFIISCGCDIDSCGFDQLTALHNACISGSEATAQLLMSQGANVQLKDRRSRSPLLCATTSGSISIVMALLDAGAAVDGTDDDGTTALWHAMWLGYTEIGQLLQSKGSDPNVADTSGVTPLILASKYGRCEIISMLLGWGVDTECTDVCGYTALLSAASSGHSDAIWLLQEAGADLHFVDVSGRDALFIAVSKGHEILTAQLLPQFDVNKTDRYGRTTLHAAAILGYLGLCRTLLSTERIDYNARDNFGRTALYDATMQGHHGIVELLQEHSAVSNGPPGRAKYMSGAGVAYRACDACLVDIGRPEAFHHCFICHGGDFDLCDLCHQIGVRCLNGVHQMTMHTGRSR
ncbi:unnamed protein product [Penicillium olsonii]|nr:unnamed protein product [Penicillium olsonii]